MRRIFNNGSFEDGGRFYGGWWQQIPSKYRAAITIDGKRTMQYDFSGMHFSIMYAEKGLDIPESDPYTLVGYDPSLRGAIKKAFNIIINSANKHQAKAAIDKRIENGEFSSELGSGEQLLSAFEKTHPLIKDKIASGAGIKGQIIDSQIAERILLKGIDIDLCILPIHDGFITTRSADPILYQFMEEAFEEITGRNAKIKFEPFDLEIAGVTPNISETHKVTRPDGTVEENMDLTGEAIGYEQYLEKDDIWGKIENVEKNKKLRDKRKKESIDAGGKHDYLD
jgi:hypothetical protein